MAHTCPDCGQYCTCGGDVDDIDWGDEGDGALNCSHCWDDKFDHDNDDYDEIDSCYE